MSVLLGFLKGMAVLCITGGAGMYGYCYLREMQQKKVRLEEMIRIIDGLEQQAVYGKSTIAEAFISLKKYGEEEESAMMGKILMCLETGDKGTLQESWRIIVDKYAPFFNSEEKKHAYAILECFATQNPEKTGELLQREKEFFSKQLAGRMDESKEKDKTVIRVCLLLGLFLCIALW